VEEEEEEENAWGFLVLSHILMEDPEKDPKDFSFFSFFMFLFGV